ncbi:Uncharacterized protein QTN25_002313 [Entamoeba marina]
MNFVSAYFYVTIPSVSIHFLVLFLLTCGAYGSICWVFYQLDTNPDLQQAMKKEEPINEQETHEESNEESNKPIKSD